MAEEEFFADYRNAAAARYLLLVAAEAAIDVCNHVVARRDQRVPTESSAHRCLDPRSSRG